MPTNFSGSTGLLPLAADREVVERLGFGAITDDETGRVEPGSVESAFAEHGPAIDEILADF